MKEVDINRESDELDVHDIKPAISMSMLEEIDLEPVRNLTEQLISRYIRELAERASVGQLRQALRMTFDDPDMEREALVDTFVERKMSVVRNMRNAVGRLA